MIRKQVIRRLNLKRVIAKFLPLTLLFAGVFYSFSEFKNINYSTIEERNQAYIRDYTTGLQQRIDDTFTNSLATIKSLSYLYSLSDLSVNNTVEILGDIENETQYDSIYYIDSNGMVYTSEGIVNDVNGVSLNINNKRYFKEGMKGASGIIFQTPLITKQRQILFYAPISRENEIVGLLVGGFSEDAIIKILSTYFYGFKADTMLVNQDGEIIAMAVNQELEEFMKRSTYPNSITTILDSNVILNEENRTIVMNAYKNLSNASFTHHGEGVNTMGYITRLESVPWMLCQIFPSRALNVMKDNANKAGSTLQLHLIIIFEIYIFYLIFLQKYIEREIRNELTEKTRMSLHDEMTNAYNRRSYDEDVLKIKRKKQQNKITLIAIDVNGLKHTNDSLGHCAGDELIIGTAQTLKSTFSKYGKVYRTGGDEFMVILNCSEDKLNKSLNELQCRRKEWKGHYLDEISFSMGIVRCAEYPDKTFNEIVNLVDNRMYEDKKAYYERTGKHHRRE